MPTKIKKETAASPELRPRSAPIIERAPLPIVEVEGRTHIVTYVNAAFCSLLEKPRTDLLGKSFSEIVPGGPECLPILDKVYQTGEAATLAKEDDSEPAHWLYAMWPTLDEKERPSGVIIQLTKATQFRQNVTDVNEALILSALRQHEMTAEAEHLNAQLIQSQRETRRARDYAEDTLRTAPVPLLILRADLRVNTTNDAFCKTFQVKPGEAEGKLIYDLGNRQWNIPELRELLENILPKNKVFNDFEVTHDFEGIGPRTMLLNARRMENETGEPMRIILAIEDITKRKQAEEALRASEERIRALFELGPVAIYACDVSGVITDFNHRSVELWGRKPRLGDTDHRFCGSFKMYQPDRTFVPHDQNPMAEVLAGKIAAVRDMEVFIERPNGTWVSVVTNIVALKDENGKVTGAINCFYDITERKIMEQTLRESEERYRNLFNLMDQGYCIIEMIFDGNKKAVDYRFLEVNPGFQKQTGMMGVTGKRMREFVSNIEDQWLVNYGKVAVTGKPVRFAGEYKDLDRWFDVYAFRVGDPGTNKVAVLFKNITDRRNKDFALQKAKEQIDQHATDLEKLVSERTSDLQATNEQLAAFVYSIAHDLRAPLRSMQGFSQMLVDDYAASLDETARNFLNRIRASSEFMDKMILDLLAFGGAGRSETKLESVKVQTAWDSAVYQYATQIEQTHAQIETVEPLPSVRANEATLAQTLANLLSNGLKFVPEGIQPKIRLWAEDRGETVRLWVEDNGVGIPPEYQERIFRVFERLNGARFPGTGIGLPIVRKGIERMGGKVGLESEPGKGSRFWIELQKA